MSAKQPLLLLEIKTARWLRGRLPPIRKAVSSAPSPYPTVWRSRPGLVNIAIRLSRRPGHSRSNVYRCARSTNNFACLRVMYWQPAVAYVAAPLSPQSRTRDTTSPCCGGCPPTPSIHALGDSARSSGIEPIHRPATPTRHPAPLPSRCIARKGGPSFLSDRVHDTPGTTYERCSWARPRTGDLACTRQPKAH